MSGLLGLLLLLVVVLLVLWAVQRLLQAFSVPEPIAGVVWVIAVIVVIVWVMSALGGYVTLPRIR